jgi:hypothetical protein
MEAGSNADFNPDETDAAGAQTSPVRFLPRPNKKKIDTRWLWLFQLIS